MQADDAIDDLESSRREACNEYNKRIRQLRGFQSALKLAAQKNTGEMFDFETTISPDIKRLLEDPTHSLIPTRGLNP